MQMSPIQSDERRQGAPAIPQGVENYLSPEQIRGLHQLESFGWELAFVRRPLFLEAVAVVVNASQQSHAILDRNGELDFNGGLVLRS